MQPLQRNIVTPESTQQTLFSYNAASAVASVKGKKVALDFQGGNITSDAGLLLLRETELKLGLITMLAKCINDTRRSSSITHQKTELLTQRILQIACGYEDANDSNSLRKDPALKMALGLLPVYEGFSGKLITTILRPGKRPGGKEIVSYVKRIAIV